MARKGNMNLFIVIFLSGITAFHANKPEPNHTFSLNSVNQLYNPHNFINHDRLNQSGYEPLDLENRSFVDSDNFDATDLRF